MEASGTDIALQHLIDPEVCIRCNTCEETCPIKAITHDSRNYVVDFSVCNGCNACIAPCPTGSIDHWRKVARQQPYSLEDQLAWDSLPPQQVLEVAGKPGLPEEVARLTAEAAAGQGGPSAAPWSAAQAYVNLYTLQAPAVATVTGNFALTAPGASNEIRHIVLDFGNSAFPVLEGQSIGVVPPGSDEQGRPHHVRLYSIASPRDGERPGYNNVSITVKRVREGQDGSLISGIASNYLCDLQRGEQVRVVGPYGTSYLMPNHPGSSLMMICTGTGSAPMRAMTERRRRRMALNEGGELLLFFGARQPEELPYFGPLLKLPKDFIDINFAFSRVPGQAKTYVQDLIRQRSDAVSRMLANDDCYIYVCGLKGMEAGVVDAFRQCCAEHGMNWDALHPQLLAKNRFHVETY